MTTPENTKLIPLSQGKHAIVDAEDYEWLIKWKWCYHHWGYAVRTERQKINGKKKDKTIMMHRLIMDTPKGMDTDHIDTNKLHNWRSNLRVATRTQNKQNTNKRKGATSRYKGVCLKTGQIKWTAQIFIGNKKIHLGLFDSELDAAKAYNAAAPKYFGEFARLNAI